MFISFKKLYEIDKRRQNYDTERQDYILRLLQTIKKLQLRSSRMISSDSENDFPNESQKKVESSHSKKLTEENQNNEKTLLQQSYERSLKENVILQKDFEELRKSFDQLLEELSKKESERIQVLQFQAKVHKEDFDSEKRDKEIALKELKKISDENHVLTKKCQKYEKKIQNFVEMFRKLDLFENKKDLKQNSSHNINGKNVEQIRTNSLPNDFRLKVKSKQIKTVLDSEDMIECPNCQILYSLQFYDQLLEHFEKCQSNN